jgi:hypothetical protein
MTEKLALNPFESKGMWPKNPDVILKRFDDKEQEEAAEASRLTGSDWRHIYIRSRLTTRSFTTKTRVYNKSLTPKSRRSRSARL